MPTERRFYKSTSCFPIFNRIPKQLNNILEKTKHYSLVRRKKRRKNAERGGFFRFFRDVPLEFSPASPIVFTGLFSVRFF